MTSGLLRLLIGHHCLNVPCQPIEIGLEGSIPVAHLIALRNDLLETSDRNHVALLTGRSLLIASRLRVARVLRLTLLHARHRHRHLRLVLLMLMVKRDESVRLTRVCETMLCRPVRGRLLCRLMRWCRGIGDHRSLGKHRIHGSADGAGVDGCHVYGRGHLRVPCTSGLTAIAPYVARDENHRIPLGERAPSVGLTKSADANDRRRC